MNKIKIALLACLAIVLGTTACTKEGDELVDLKTFAKTYAGAIYGGTCADHDPTNMIVSSANLTMEKKSDDVMTLSMKETMTVPNPMGGEAISLDLDIKTDATAAREADRAVLTGSTKVTLGPLGEQDVKISGTVDAQGCCIDLILPIITVHFKNK